jgi:hypothetical protein
MTILSRMKRLSAIERPSGRASSLTYRIIDDADHALSAPLYQKAYTSLLVNWMTEMVLGLRRRGTA